MVHLLLKYLPIMFASGFVTSYAEKRFNYSLYETVTGLFKKKKS